LDPAAAILSGTEIVLLVGARPYTLPERSAFEVPATAPVEEARQAFAEHV
jgi:hypothetical protein